MTAHASSSQGINGFAILLLVLAIAFSVMCSMAIVVSSQPHAVKAHGSEAEMVRECMKKDHYPMRFQKEGTNRYYNLCQLPDGRWGLMVTVIERVGDVLKEVEITSFIPKNGTLDAVMNYLVANGVK